MFQNESKDYKYINILQKLQINHVLKNFLIHFAKIIHFVKITNKSYTKKFLDSLNFNFLILKYIF